MSLLHLYYKKLSDEEVMLHAAKGRDSAFEELYLRYARRLQGFFYRHLGGDRDTAEDYTHDVFLSAYTARNSYREGTPVDAWLFTMAYNLCRNTYRHLQVTQAYEQQFSEEPFADEAPDLDMDRQTLDTALGQVLSELPEEVHLLFSLHYEEQLSVPQIAAMTGLPEGTVKSRLHHIITIIRKKLKPYESIR